MENNNLLPKFWHVIINPMALRGGSIDYWRVISTRLVSQGFTFKEWYTTAKNDASHIAQNLVNEGSFFLIVVGGDGTLNEVVNGIMHCQELVKNVILAVIPAGTGNDWSRTHRFPRKKKDIVTIFLSGDVILHDIGIVTQINHTELPPRYFINIAGLGFDAAVIDRVHSARKFKVAKGLVYIKHLILSLVNYQTVDCKLVFDQKIENKSVFSIAAGICKYNGNGMMPVPMAVPTDGMLDVVVIEKMKFWQLFTQIPALFKGTYIRHPKVFHRKVQGFEVFPKTSIQCEVEGEMVGEGCFKIEIAPHKIKVLIPTQS